MGNDCALDASHDSLPLMGLAYLASCLLLVGELSSEESACRLIFPLEDGSVGTASDLAPWQLGGSKTGWEAVLHELVEWSTDGALSWSLGVEWNPLLVEDPFAALESVPLAMYVFVDIATVMPVALVPGPAGSGESRFGWAPIVPAVVIPSVPDALLGNPLPSDCGGLGVLAPGANLWHALVFLNEAKAGSLSAKNVAVLLVDLSLGLAVMCLVCAFDFLSGFGYV